MNETAKTGEKHTPKFKWTPKQAEVRALLAGPQRHALIYGGSRSGKTFLLCHKIAERAIVAPGSRHLITRLRFNHAKASIWHDTFPKMMALCFPQARYKPNKQDWFWEFGNGSQVWIGGLDDKERSEKVLGNEYATIYFNEASQLTYDSVLTLRTRLAQNVQIRIEGKSPSQLPLRAFYDLNPSGATHWTFREFIKGEDPTTGRALPQGSRAYAVMNPTDNAENLPADYIAELESLPEIKRRRFLEGRYVESVDGALFPPQMFAVHRRAPQELPRLKRIVIAVDPSGTRGDGMGDDIGIIVAGIGEDGRAYVIEDATCQLSPEGWGRRVIDRYHAHKADCIVAERNYGGDMVRFVISTADKNAKFKEVVATRGKHVRAEPVAALYERGIVSHVGRFPDLEDQLASFTTQGYIGEGSPDRGDALIWALTELMVDTPPAAFKMQSALRGMV